MLQDYSKNFIITEALSEITAKGIKWYLTAIHDMMFDREFYYIDQGGAMAIESKLTMPR